MSGDPLPLFPLRTVLLPRMPLRLHVFEARYTELVRKVLDGDRSFGVVLIKEGSETAAPITPHAVGTRARILATEPLSDGGMNLLAVGTERFRLLETIAGEEPYLIGLTEPIQDSPADAAVYEPLLTDLTGLFRTYLATLFHEADLEAPDYELPDQAQDFSFVLGAVVQTDNATRQSLLEMTDTAARLSRQKQMLEQELARLRGLCARASRWKPYLSRN